MAKFHGYLHNYPSVDDQKTEDELHYRDDSVFLGYVQMSGDATSTERIYENESYCIVFTGAIYNKEELRSELEENGYSFSTTSTTEVLLALYKEHEEKMLTKLRGMFSLLIWDKEEKKLFGARDPFGIKPFFYTEDEAGLSVAGEVKYLVDGGPRELNEEGLHHYLTYQYVPEPQVMEQGIKRLEPGHYFTKKPNEPMHIATYWKPNFEPNEQSTGAPLKEIRDVVRDSVHAHLQTERKIGAFLSGGVDSSAVVALAKEIHPEIQTFTVGFEREGYSEIDIAKETAAQLGVDNHHYIVEIDEFISELPKIIKEMETPVADPAAIPLYFISREAKKHVDVILSGEGADELFGGYNIYREPSSLRMFQYVPKSMHATLNQLANKLPEGTKGKSFIDRGTTPLEDRFIGNAKLFNELEKSMLLTNYRAEYDHRNITAPLYEEVTHYPDVQKMQYIDLHTWVRGDILVKANRMTAAHGLEIRSPYMDLEVFNVASKLTPEQCVTKETTKYAMREALRGIVPDSVLYNRKLGFPVPLRYWLKNELYDWAKQLIEESEVDHLFNKDYALDLLEAHRDGKIDYSRKIWAILVFVIWHEQAMGYEEKEEESLSEMLS
ncbi:MULTISPECIES: asparagine synthase (glutamine-hydrolyzing) [Allobacillus]|uniref:asparagine synthase (glutamine-hydrolyzing) n=1 Tax=Allobacillus salarius TaxID=1955272 RepID=A0A556PKN4_9BACI|nr:asparagine synthase (glutamine-hydrolyzing) [Allobacillus salarius]TSJ64945.1 asparagine synthase (glutamine-hydrolyzing) [Allobacillus salarius]